MGTEITPENHAYIDAAVAAGRFANRQEAINEAIRKLQQDAATEDAANRPIESPATWLADLKQWAASHPAVLRPVDDSRESIYLDRGE